MAGLKAKPVEQYELVPVLVKKHVSINKAAKDTKDTKINASSISTACSSNGKNYTAGGFLWKYAD